MQKSKIVLVTGGAGFIGSHIAKRLIQEGHKVIVIDDLSGGFRQNLPKGCKFIRLDVTSSRLVNWVFHKYRPNIVYHAAAYAAEGLSPFIRNYNYKVNVLGSINVINACINFGVEHLAFLSSIAVYGEQKMLETVHPKPIDPYGISKYAIELDIQSAHSQFGLNYSIFRPHNVFGENQNIGDDYRNLLGILMRAKLNRQPYRIFGDGSQTRSFTYINDAVLPMTFIPFQKELANQIWNIGTDKSYTVKQIVEMLQTPGENIVYEPKRHEVHLTKPSHAKLKKAQLYYETDIQYGLSRMWDWVKALPKNDPRLKPLKEFKHIEITKQLPPAWQKKK